MGDSAEILELKARLAEVEATLTRVVAKVEANPNRVADSSSPWGFATPPTHVDGCVCPKGAEETCRATNCPRKDPPQLPETTS